MASSPGSPNSPLGSPVVPSITGSVPGQLDPTQPPRLLRTPGSKLSFAAYDPRTAIADSGLPDIRKLNINKELYRPKRVVIETTPQGAAFWRFVPKARMSDHMMDEGFWPRVVSICGQPIHCSLDQWDIYKLDPHYECILKPHPDMSEIHHKPPPPPPLEPSQPSGEPRPSSSTPVPEMPQPRPKRERQKSRHVSFADSDSEEEVSGMFAEVPSRRPATARAPSHPRVQSVGPSPSRRRASQMKEAERKARQEKLARHSAKVSEREKENRYRRRAEYSRMPQDVSMQSVHEYRTEDFETPIQPAVPKRSVRSVPAPKRKADPDDDNNEDYEDNHEGPSTKKHRTASPSKRKLDQKRFERFELKGGKWQNIRGIKSEVRDDIFLQETIQEYNATNFEYNDAGMDDLPDHDNLPHEFPPSDLPPESEGPSSQQTDPEPELDPEQERQASLAASIRKLSEFANDKPIRDEAERRIKMQEEAEQAALKAKAEARKAEALAAKQKEARQRSRSATVGGSGATDEDSAEALHRAREAAIQRNIRRRQKQQWHRWRNVTPWTAELALARTNVLAPIFDATKFSSLEPLEFIDVPWPVLYPSGQFGIEDVTWEAVEEFLRTVRPYMDPVTFRIFIQEAQRRFHPDRWRSRNLLAAIENVAERNCIEIAANAVAQAVTPVWQELR